MTNTIKSFEELQNEFTQSHHMLGSRWKCDSRSWDTHTRTIKLDGNEIEVTKTGEFSGSIDAVIADINHHLHVFKNIKIDLTVDNNGHPWAFISYTTRIGGNDWKCVDKVAIS